MNDDPRRPRWKVPAVVVVLSVIVIGVLFLFLSRTPDRREFVGKPDPVSGYRCRCTVSLAWQNDLPTQKQSSDNDVLIAKEPLSPIKEWIESHVFHRPPAQPAGISLSHSSLQGDPGSFQVIAGYPEPPPGSQEPLVHEHLLIGHCPTTLFQSQITQGGTPYRLMVVYIYVPDAAMVFTLFGDAEVSHAGALDREMREIIGSFHVEKEEPGGKK